MNLVDIIDNLVVVNHVEIFFQKSFPYSQVRLSQKEIGSKKGTVSLSFTNATACEEMDVVRRRGGLYESRISGYRYHGLSDESKAD